jgi:hypothetical protein
MRITPLLYPTAAAAVLGLAACGGTPTSPDGTAPDLRPQVNTTASFTAPAPVRGQVTVCKVGTDVTFDVNNDGTPGTVSVADGTCEIAAPTPNPNTSGRVVTVTENVPANTVLDSIIVIRGVAAQNQSFPQTVTTQKLTGTTSATTTVGLEGGTVMVFYNTFTPPPPPPPPPPPGGQGCTPGYWKQSHHFDSWPAPYLPTASFASAGFTNAFPGMSLVDVLSQGGGGLKALGRHAVAALLNAASPGVSYDLTVAQVISGFNAAVASGNHNGQKNIFEAFNEQGCPLN